MTLVPEIRDQLHATARRRSTSTQPRRPPLHAWRRMTGGVILAASALVVAGVAAVILLNAHHQDKPPTASATTSPHAVQAPPGWGKLNTQALTSVQHHDHACQPKPATGALLLDHASPGKALTSVLDWLRQPTPAGQRLSKRDLTRLDLLPTLKSQRRPLALARDFAHGIYLRYARKGQRKGITYYLIPAADVNQTRPIPDRCYHETLTVFRRLAAQRPTDQQSALTSYETSSLHRQQTLARHPAGICLATTGPGGSGAGPCVNAVSLQQHQYQTSFGPGGYGNDHETITPLLVPDNVATVTAHYSAQTYPGRVAHPLTITERAKDNLVIMRLHGAWDPPSSLTYRSASGHTLWTITRP